MYFATPQLQLDHIRYNMATSYSIYYLILPDGMQPISIRIEPTATIGELITTMWQREPRIAAQFGPGELRLYQVDAPGINVSMKIQEAKERMRPSTRKETLDPFRKLSALYPSTPPEGVIHIVVQLPDENVDEPQFKRRKIGTDPEKVALHVLTAIAPSSMSERPILFKEVVEKGTVFCNRPYNHNALPIELLAKEFGQFREDCMQTPSTTAIELLQALATTACDWHENEHNYRVEMNKVYKDYANLSLAARDVAKTKYLTDGHTDPIIIPASLHEYRLYAGAALFESINHFGRFVKERLQYAQYTRFPCILVTTIGPVSTFYGGLWIGERLIIEPLAPALEFPTPLLNETERRRMASVLQAYLNTVNNINQHYKEVKRCASNPQIGRIILDRSYPYPTEFVDNSGATVNFRYINRQGKKPIFYATINDEEPLCIKFTRRYCESAHSLLCKAGYAPFLRKVESIPGGWKMVVMDQSKSSSLATKFPDYESKVLIKHSVEKAVQLLHESGFVHGDVLQPNILVNDQWDIQLIDFDWAGKEGETRYPLLVNTVTVSRPTDVCGEGLITKQHDLEMIERLFLTV